ncbi:MAG: nucleotidyltransferase [Phycisphaerae bacterium]|nr:nucleotidyltransferase [Phycisphaerae bacterium]
MAKPQLLVMAAGIGSRYGGLKQIDPVGPSGEIVLDYAVYDAIRAGFGKVIFVIRKEIEDVFREKVGKTIEKHIDTAYAFQDISMVPDDFDIPPERTKPWGTAHALLCAADAVTAPFAAINADDFYGRDSFRVLGEHLSSAEDGETYDFSSVGFVLSNTLTEHGHVARGICTVNGEGYLDAVVERTKIQQFGDDVKFTEDDENWADIDGESIVSLNMWGFTPVLLDEIRQRFGEFLKSTQGNLKAEYYIPTVVNELIQEGKARVKILPTKSRWYGVTYQPDKQSVKDAIAKMVENGEYPQKLWD